MVPACLRPGEADSRSLRPGCTGILKCPARIRIPSEEVRAGLRTGSFASNGRSELASVGSDAARASPDGVSPRSEAVSACLETVLGRPATVRRRSPTVSLNPDAVRGRSETVCLHSDVVSAHPVAVSSSSVNVRMAPACVSGNPDAVSVNPCCVRMIWLMSAADVPTAFSMRPCEPIWCANAAFTAVPEILQPIVKRRLP